MHGSTHSLIFPQAETARSAATILLAVDPECLHGFFAEPLEDLLPACKIARVEGGSPQPGGWPALLGEVRPDVIVTGWSTPLLSANDLAEGGGTVRYICHLTGSIRPIVSRSVIESGIPVSNWGKLISHTVAEHAVLLTLACLRNLNAWPSAFAAEPSQWAAMQRRIQTRSLRGRRVGIHGIGSVAFELARYLRPFEPRIQAYSEGAPERLFHQAGVMPCGSLEELFSRNDILIECEALNERTRGVVDESLLRRLPDEAVFVNIGRGALVDENALIRVACEKRLRVGLDVFGREPLPHDSPVSRIPGIVLSPHIAGPTLDWYARCGQFAVENIRRFLGGEPPLAQVDQETYDRST